MYPSVPIMNMFGFTSEKVARFCVYVMHVLLQIIQAQGVLYSSIHKVDSYSESDSVSGEF